MTDHNPYEFDLWHYFEHREEAIVKIRQELADELEALREARSALEKKQRDKEHFGPKEKLTIKEMIRAVLTKNPEGGTADQIINWINQNHGIEVARTSLSPQLSRLKSDSEVLLDEETGLWRLVDARTRNLESHRGFHARDHELEMIKKRRF